MWEPLKAPKETTMLREKTYTGMLGRWQRLLAPLGANLAELAHLELPHGKLQALLARALEINQQQAALTASKQEMSRQLKQIMGEGERLATLLLMAVKEHYGIRAEKLAEFGLQPFRGRPRTAKPAPETPDPAPPVPSNP